MVSKKSEDAALKYYMKAADFRLAQANINAALLLDRRKEYKKAIPYFQEASKLMFLSADKDKSGSLDLNEASIYINQEIFPSKKAKDIQKGKE